MFAHVKFIISGKYKTVAIADLEQYKPNRSNKICFAKDGKDFQKALVIAVGESEKELSKRVDAERKKTPPAALLSEPSEDEKQIDKKYRTEVKNNNTLSILNTRLLQKDPVRFHMENSLKLKSTDKMANNKAKTLAKDEDIKQKLKKDLPVKRKEEVLCSPITLRKPFKQPKISNKNKKNSIESQDQIKSNQIEEHLKTIDSKEDSRQASPLCPVKNTTPKVTPTTHVSKIIQEIEFVKNEMKKREIFEKNMSEQLSKALTNIEQNRKMLDKLLDNWNEFREIPSDQSSKVLEDKSGFPSVGFYRKSDKTIHIGEGFFLPKASYDAAVMKATTPAKFVKKILIPIFTPDELLDSSVKGGKSNRYKKETQKPGLDPTRLLAVRSIFEHFLKSQNNDPETVKLELKKTNEYISSKISDMRKTKPPQGKEKKKAYDIDNIDVEELEFELGNAGTDDQVENEFEHTDSDDVVENQNQRIESDLEDEDKENKGEESKEIENEDEEYYKENKNEDDEK